MNVRKLRMPDGTETFTVVGPDGPVEPIDTYLAVLEAAGRSPNTMRGYAYDLAQFFRWLGARRLSHLDVTLSDLADYVRHVRTTTARALRREDRAVAAGDAAVIQITPDTNAGRQASTAQRHLTTLFGFYEHLGFALDLPLGRQLHMYAQQAAPRRRVGGEWLTKQSRPITIDAPAPEPVALPAEHVCRLLDACEHRRDRLLLALLWTPGLRVGQALALRHSDINGRRREVSVVPRGDEPLDARTKRKPGQTLTLPLEESVVRLHAAYMHIEYGDLDSDFVFVNLWGRPHGARMTYQGVRSVIETLTRRTGIPFTPHQLRHSFATDLLRSGARKELVQALLGHASIRTTDMYDQRTVEDMRAELEQLQRSVNW